MARRIAGFAVLGAVAVLATACTSASSSTPAASGSSGSPSAPSTPSTASGSPSAPSAPSASPAASAHAAGVPSCATSGLTVTLGGSQGTAGSIYQVIDFTNNGSSECTLYGYPGVSLQGGLPLSQVGAAAARDTTTPASLVTLAPGAVANAVLQITIAGNYPASTCDPQAATTLLVYPPNQTASAMVHYGTTGCSSTSVTLLHVSAVQSGAGSAG
jgi:hypothetical protein